MPCTSAIAFPRETEVNDDSKIVIFLAMTGAAVLTIMAAESLTRKAFGGHIQLWKIWTREVAASPAVLGRTVVGYLLVGIFFAYEVALYFFANEKLGWWVPSGALFDPDILATYFPFYHGLSISLWAGLWEECLYRAVPLAAAALLGTRFGGRRYWILGTLFFQAVLFGASHANYPMQPAYARIVEMTLLFMLVGVLFLVFGLLPVIVMHFVFDSVWFALPLFASSVPGIWINRSLIIVLTLVPLWVALYARWRHGRWGEVADNALNRAWMPPPPPERPAMPGTVVLSAGLGRRTQLALAGMGLVGIALWIGASSFTGETPTFKADRTRTMRAARHALEQHGITLDDSWRELASVDGQVDWRDRFVWQEGGAKTYRNLFGSYLQPPRWYVRYACFEGDVAERAEEYGIWVDGEGKVRRFKHTLPEARAGESLDENAAHALAHEAHA